MAKSKDAAGRRRLGRGLQSLVSAPVRIDVLAAETPNHDPAPSPLAPSAPNELNDDLAGSRPSHLVQMLPVNAIRPSPHQPRRDFDEGALERLAQSIRSAGLMQPVVVRPDGEGGHQLIAGERRWRAAQRLGLNRLPAIVHEVDDRTAAQWSLVENLQREDLNALERAEAFRRLGEEFSLTHEEIAREVGLDRTSVTNHLRLLELEASVQVLMREGRLSMGHGRALLALANHADQRRFARLVLEKQWSVRELERRVRKNPPPNSSSHHTPTVPPAHAHLHDLQRRLAEHLGTNVHIRPARRKGAGRILIDFYDLDQFEGLMQRFGFRCE